MKIMRKIKIITIKKIIKRKKSNNNNKKTSKQTNTITTNKTLIYNRKSTYREREREKITYLLHPNCKKTTLSNMQRKHHVH